MKGKRIGLYGIGGLYNYGCEAIVRGTVRLIRHVQPDASISYFTPRFDEDSQQIADLGINVVPMPPAKRGFALKVAGKISKVFTVPFDSTGESYETILNGCDVLVSIGGDIYTIPEHIRQKKRYPYFNRLIRLGELARGRGVREVILGASIGPFGSFNRAVAYYADHLKNCDAIFCRECVTVDYLKSIGISSNVTLMPDPAFFVDNPKNLPPYEDARYIGINLSPLSLRELHGEVANDSVKELACQIQNIMDETKLPAMLIPHVFASRAEDNDEYFLRLVLKNLDETHRKRCEVVTPKSFIDAKCYLARCQVVIAARMHCAVNAICVGVPTILLSYSKKSIGMCELVYGDRGWVVPLGDGDGLRNAIASLYPKRAEVHAYLENRVKELSSVVQNAEAFNELSRVIA